MKIQNIDPVRSQLLKKVDEFQRNPTFNGIDYFFPRANLGIEIGILIKNSRGGRI